MKNFTKHRMTLDDAMKICGVEWTGEPHIVVDPKVKYQYRIIRHCDHDGTLLFSHDLIVKAMENLLCRTSYYRRDPIPEGMVPRYTIGRIRIAAVFGMVDLKCGRYPGMRESVIIPVRVEHVPIPAPEGTR